MFNKILLCTHGTDGAMKAEKYVFEKILSAKPDTEVIILTVISKDWELMIGDDWLNTSKTHRKFMGHVNDQLVFEIEEDWDRIRSTYKEAENCSFKHIVGEVEEAISDVAARLECDLVVTGPYQKKRGRGLKSKIKPEKLHHKLSVPVLIAT